MNNMEGALARGRLVVIEFESQEAAKRWYTSPEYPSEGIYQSHNLRFLMFLT